MVAEINYNRSGHLKTYCKFAPAQRDPIRCDAKYTALFVDENWSI